jgi:hypothetical protein
MAGASRRAERTAALVRWATAARAGTVGVLLLIGSAAALFASEAGVARRSLDVSAAGTDVVSVDAAAVDPANNGKRVHVVGAAGAVVPILDNRLNVRGRGLALRRQVEMFQWLEQTARGENGAARTYVMGWSATPADSRKFKAPEGHENPAGMPVDSHTFYAGTARLGGFRLAPELLEQVSGFEPLSLPEEILGQLPEELRGNARLVNGSLYFGKDAAHPQVGDLRVAVSVAGPRTVSVVARQFGNTLSEGRRDSEAALLWSGEHAAEEMCREARGSGALAVWAVRIGATLLMFGGARLANGRIGPALRGAPGLDGVERLPAAVLAIGVGAAGSLGMGGLAWVAFRAWIGGSLLIGAAAVGAWMLLQVRMLRLLEGEAELAGDAAADGAGEVMELRRAA